MHRPKEMGNASVMEKSQMTSAKHSSFVTMNVQHWLSCIGMSCQAQLSLTISHEAGCIDKIAGQAAPRALCVASEQQPKPIGTCAYTPRPPHTHTLCMCIHLSIYVYIYIYTPAACISYLACIDMYCITAYDYRPKWS